MQWRLRTCHRSIHFNALTVVQNKSPATALTAATSDLITTRDEVEASWRSLLAACRLNCNSRSGSRRSFFCVARMSGRAPELPTR
jgi:hypothetical protein